MSHPSEGLLRFKVGGTILLLMDKIENIASTAPAAPNKCPIADLVEDIDREYSDLEEIWKSEKAAVHGAQHLRAVRG